MAPVVVDEGEGASDFFSGSGVVAGVSGAAGADSSGFSGSVADGAAGAASDFVSGAAAAGGVDSAGAAAGVSAAGAGAVSVAGAGAVSSAFFSLQAVKPAAAQVRTAAANTLPNLFTSFLFYLLIVVCR